MSRRLLALSAVLAGSSLAAGLIDPVDPFVANHLFVADAGTQVLEFDAAGVPQPTYVQGSTALLGLGSAQDLAFGPEGALYVSDAADDLVHVFDSLGGAPRASLGAPGLDAPGDLAFGPHGQLFVASVQADVVLRFDRDGQLLGSVGAGSGLDEPRGLAFAPDGHLWVSSAGSDELLEFDPSGVLLAVHGAGSPLDGPHGLAFSPRNGLLYVASHAGDEVLVFDTQGSLQDGFGSADGLLAPTAVSFGPDGLLYVASSGSGEVLAFHADGTLDRRLGGGVLGTASGLAFAPFVLAGSVKGKLQLHDGKALKVKQDARLNWAPGSGRSSLLLVGDEGGEAPAALLGHDTFVGSGFETAPAAPGPQVHLVVQELDASALIDGIGVLALSAKGSAVNLTGIKSLTGLFSPKKLEGELDISGPQGSLHADVKAGSDES